MGTDNDGKLYLLIVYVDSPGFSDQILPILLRQCLAPNSPLQIVQV